MFCQVGLNQSAEGPIVRQLVRQRKPGIEVTGFSFPETSSKLSF